MMNTTSMLTNNYHLSAFAPSSFASSSFTTPVSVLYVYGIRFGYVLLSFHTAMFLQLLKSSECPSPSLPAPATKIAAVEISKTNPKAIMPTEINFEPRRPGSNPTTPNASFHAVASRAVSDQQTMACHPMQSCMA